MVLSKTDSAEFVDDGSIAVTVATEPLHTFSFLSWSGVSIQPMISQSSLHAVAALGNLLDDAVWAVLQVLAADPGG